MEEKKIKIKNILIMVLIFVIGFGTGMVFAFQTTYRIIERNNIKIESLL